MSVGLLHRYSHEFNPYILNLFLFTIHSRIIFKFGDRLSALSRMRIKRFPSAPWADTLRKAFSSFLFDDSSALGALLTGNFISIGLIYVSRSQCLVHIFNQIILGLIKLLLFPLSLTVSKLWEPNHIPCDACNYICIQWVWFYIFPRSFFNIDFSDNWVSSLYLLVLSICGANWVFALF